MKFFQLVADFPQHAAAVLAAAVEFIAKQVKVAAESDRIVGFKRSWSSLRFQIKNRRVNPSLSLHHGIDRKVLPDTAAAGTTIDFRNSSKGPNCFSDVVNQKTGLPVLDHLTARAEVHRDDGYASGIGLDPDKSESLRDGVQVQ